MRTARRVRGSVDEDNPYWMSFSDIMSSLLVIFILAAVVLIIQLVEAQQELEKKKIKFNEEIEILKKAEDVRKTILEEAAEALIEKGIIVTVSENHSVLSIPNEILGFGTGKYELEDRYERTAQQIGLVLYEVISQGDRIGYLDTIFVEGHTDNRAFKGFKGKGNWGLSAFRAISLWQYWLSELPSSSRLDGITNKDGQLLFSVSGYGETRPVKEIQITEEDYRLNRRIDIRFTIRRPTSEEYKEINLKLAN